MTGPDPADSPAAPSPDAAPAGRRVGATPEGSPTGTRRGGTALIRIGAPELARRAQLERSRGRLLMAAAGFATLFGAVAFQLTRVTLLDPQVPRPRPVVQVPTGEPVAGRAPILDRNGEVLAASLPVSGLYARPAEIADPVAATDRLRRVLPDLDRERLIARLTPGNIPGTERPRQFAYIARGLTPRQQQAVNNLGIGGLYFEEAERRVYPLGRNAVHVLGGVDVDAEGIAGAERWFDERLRQNHAPLRLSVDIRVQVAMREAVARAIQDFSGIGGAGILMDVQTSEVLALVSLPDYDANDPASATHCDPALNRRTNICERFNRVISGVYEPGSTFKLLTAAMALEAGTVNLWSGYDASQPIHFGRFTISDYKGKGRWLALPEIIAYSSNIATARMAAAVGPHRHREFMLRMGMLARLGVELPETGRPLAPGPSRWHEIETMTIGFGHGIAVSPLHVITGVTTLVNGGMLRQPTILAQPQGPPREGTRVIAERTSDTIRRLMRLVVTEGSGRAAEVPGYFVGGKTGTAQKTDQQGRYMENKRIAVFVGAFPMQAPRYAIYVMVDEPNPNARSHGYATAGWVAAPAAQAVIARVAPILGLVPETDRVAAIQQTIAMPLQPGRPRGAAPPAPRGGNAAAPPAGATMPAAAAPAGAATAPRPEMLPPRPAEPTPIRRTSLDRAYQLAIGPGLPTTGAAALPRATNLAVNAGGTNLAVNSGGTNLAVR